MKLSNSKLTISIKTLGAELCSIHNTEKNIEYLWQAHPEYWKRHSPVLFPIVGGLWNGHYIYNNHTFAMSQHGFARDCEFTLIYHTENEVLYQLSSNDDTKKIYPFDFILEIGYKLTNNIIEVIWRVKNTGTEELLFQIGAHPAFNYPAFRKGLDVKAYFELEPSKDLVYNLISDKGCVDNNTKQALKLTDGLLPIKQNTFDHDALIFENSQIQKVRLLDSDKQPYLSLEFDAPALGLWEPPHKDAPFVCIEPWYGRCDRVNFTEDFSQKDLINKLAPNKEFETSYKIIIEQ